jgi:hypothetical protein
MSGIVCRERLFSYFYVFSKLSTEILFFLHETSPKRFTLSRNKYRCCIVERKLWSREGKNIIKVSPFVKSDSLVGKRTVMRNIWTQEKIRHLTCYRGRKDAGKSQSLVLGIPCSKSENCWNICESCCPMDKKSESIGHWTHAFLSSSSFLLIQTQVILLDRWINLGRGMRDLWVKQNDLPTHSNKI